MSGASIAAEVAAALREVALDVGAGTFTVTLLRPAAQPSNPWEAPAAAATEIPLAALVQAYPKSMIDGTLIRAEDRMVMAEASGTVPTVADRLRIGSTEYAIVGVTETAPSGVALYYEIQARA